MKKFLRSLSLLLALLMLLSAFATMISCGEEPEDPTPDTPPSEDDGGGDNNLPTPGENGKAKYTITVKTIGGRPISNLNGHSCVAQASRCHHQKEQCQHLS